MIAGSIADFTETATAKFVVALMTARAMSAHHRLQMAWMIDGELVPFDEAMPVPPPDGEVTICRRTDGSRRCVFGLKPGL
jgi:hypothetical protein